MRALFVSVVVLAGVATSSAALGADLDPGAGPVPHPVALPPAFPPGHDKIDFYAGLTGGGATAISSHVFVDGTVNTGEFPVKGGLLGGTLGFGYSKGPWLLSFESDLQGTLIDGSVNVAGAPFSTKLNWLYNFRGRVGYAFGQFIPYAAIGPAIGSVESTAPIPGLGLATTRSLRSGWSLGAGVDYVINPLLTARFEYLFICLGVATEYSVNNVEFMGNFWRVGLNYNFGTFAVRGAEEADRDFLKGAPADYNWSGFYLGAVSGGSAGQRSTKYSVAGTPVAVSFTNTNGGFRNIGYHGLAGAQAGLNWQTGHLVTGFETDFQFTQIVGHTLNSRVNVTAGGVTGTLDSVVDMPLLGTFRGRVGWAANRWLYYVTGGFAYGEVETTSTLSVPAVGSVTSNSESTPIGWAAGFGFNTALWDRWDAKLEMTWVNLAAHKDTFAGIGPIGSITASSTIGDFVWRGALNTRFNPS